MDVSPYIDSALVTEMRAPSPLRVPPLGSSQTSFYFKINTLFGSLSRADCDLVKACGDVVRGKASQSAFFLFLLSSHDSLTVKLSKNIIELQELK